MKANEQDLRRELERRSTRELTSILRNHDESEWQPRVFELAAELLESRGVSAEEVRAMGPEGIDVLESEPTVTLETFFSPAEAHVARAALQDAGIPAWVTEEVMGSMYGVGVGARVQVRAAQAREAAEFLASRPPGGTALPPELAEPPCPACGSRNVVSEAWVFQENQNAPVDDDDSARDWHYVCSDCAEAWRPE